MNTVKFLIEGSDDLVVAHSEHHPPVLPGPAEYELAPRTVSESKYDSERSYFERRPDGKVALHLPFALKQNKFLLILQSPDQRDLYVKHAAKGGLGIDATHGTNRYVVEMWSENTLQPPS